MQLPRNFGISIALVAVSFIDGFSVVSANVHPNPVRFLADSAYCFAPSEQAVTSELDACPPLIQLHVSQERYATFFDSSSSKTELYIGDNNNDRVMVHVIDSSLNIVSQPLPIEYGLVLLATDLDHDGMMELVLQRGNGFDGYVDILSEPDWHLRQSFVFPGANIEMFPVAVNLDSDADLEVYLVASDFSDNSRAVIIDHVTSNDSFQIISNITAPGGTVGQSAVADFDGDGRIEFITGNGTSYGLFEWQDTALSFIGQIPGQVAGHWAAACKPFSGGVPCAVLGSFRGNPGFTHSLIQAIGDNQFRELQLLQQSTGWNGPSSNFGADIDCDGLDEIVMGFYPLFKVLEWDASNDSFYVSCIWDKSVYGNLDKEWAIADLNQNGVPEFANVSGSSIFQSFEGPTCSSCTQAGHCDPPPVPCVCVCHADPACDGIQSDVLDVVKAIDVAFRGDAEQYDPGSLCSAKQTDVNCDQSTNIVDVVRIINVAFRGAFPATQYCNPCL